MTITSSEVWSLRQASRTAWCKVRSFQRRSRAERRARVSDFFAPATKSVKSRCWAVVSALHDFAARGLVFSKCCSSGGRASTGRRISTWTRSPVSTPILRHMGSVIPKLQPRSFHGTRLRSPIGIPLSDTSTVNVAVSPQAFPEYTTKRGTSGAMRSIAGVEANCFGGCFHRAFTISRSGGRQSPRRKFSYRSV